MCPSIRQLRDISEPSDLIIPGAGDGDDRNAMMDWVQQSDSNIQRTLFVPEEGKRCVRSPRLASLYAVHRTVYLPRSAEPDDVRLVWTPSDSSSEQGSADPTVMPLKQLSQSSRLPTCADQGRCVASSSRYFPFYFKNDGTLI